MNILQSNRDVELVNFINDYVEHRLDPIEHSVFEEYLANDAEMASFVRKSVKGRQAVNKAYRVEAADDFEEKLARRIAEEVHGADCASV